METEMINTTVLMPDDTLLEVSYYCSDKKLQAAEKESETLLYIQLDDCLCSMRINRSVCSDESRLEHIVHNKVINTRGHLC